VRPLQDQVDIFGSGGSLDVIKGSRPAFQQFSSPAETAAAQQAFQYASAGGGAPRAELVKPPTPAVQVAWDQAQAFQRQSELDTLNNMFSQAKNLPDLYRRLDQPIPGSFDKLSGTNIGVVTDPGAWLPRFLCARWVVNLFDRCGLPFTGFTVSLPCNICSNRHHRFCPQLFFAVLLSFDLKWARETALGLQRV